jgi:hypothetical protein
LWTLFISVIIMNALRLALGFAIVLGVANMSIAALITPTTIAFTGTAIEFYPTEANLINGSGLTGTPTELNYTTITHAVASTDNAWVTNDPATGWGRLFR